MVWGMLSDPEHAQIQSQTHHSWYGIILRKKIFRLFWNFFDLKSYGFWASRAFPGPQVNKNFIFSKSIFQPASCKHVLSVFFRFLNISGRYFQPRHQISYFFQKVGNLFFSANFLTSLEDSTFSSQIVRYGQTIIGTL